MSLQESMEEYASQGGRPRKEWADVSFSCYHDSWGSALKLCDLLSTHKQLTENVYCGQCYGAGFLSLGVINDDYGFMQFGFFSPPYENWTEDWRAWRNEYQETSRCMEVARSIEEVVGLFVCGEQIECDKKFSDLLEKIQ